VGSATIGGPIDLGYTVSLAVPLFDQRHVLAAPADGSPLQIVDMAVQPPLSRAIPDAEPRVSEIRVSPAGYSAALLYPASQQIQVIRGLPANPVIAFSLSTSLMDLPMRRVAVNDDASVVLVSFAENDHEIIYRWNPTDGFRLLATTPRVGALAFVGSTSAVFADSVTNEVFLAGDASRQSAVRFLAGADEGVSRPIAIGVSNRNEIILANAGSGKLMTFASDGRILGTQTCNCKLSGLYPLATGLFRLTDPLNKTMYILDGGEPGNRIAFVPPLP
jgi:hypothetical protein